MVLSGLLLIEDLTHVPSVSESCGCASSLTSTLAPTQDPSRHKVGQGAVHEVEALKEWNVSAQSFVNLHHIALHLRTQPRSLQGLVALFLKTRLMKEQRLTNWEQSPLTRAQLGYAAADAWASRQVLIAIRRAYFVDRLACEPLLGASSIEAWSGCRTNLNKLEPVNATA